jgi:hypothetical protein
MRRHRQSLYAFRTEIETLRDLKASTSPQANRQPDSIAAANRATSGWSSARRLRWRTGHEVARESAAEEPCAEAIARNENKDRIERDAAAETQPPLEHQSTNRDCNGAEIGGERCDCKQHHGEHLCRAAQKRPSYIG